MHRRALILAGLLLPLGAEAARADIPPAAPVTPIRFRPGASSATVGGRVHGYDTALFSVSVRQGQTLTVSLRPSNRNLMFSIRNPRRATVSDGTMRDGQTVSLVAEMAGAYEIMVFFMRNEARRGARSTFSLTAAVTG